MSDDTFVVFVRVSVYVGPIPILMEDAIMHTTEHPYCNDPDCPCHEELAAFEERAEQALCEAGMTERWEWLPWQGGGNGDC